MGCTQANSNLRTGRISDEERFLQQSFIDQQLSMHENLPKIVRQDLSQIKQPQAPKNTICLVSISPQLLPLLQNACAMANANQNTERTNEVDQLMSLLNLPTQAKFSEIQFCQNMAKQQLQVFVNAGNLLPTLIALTETFSEKLGGFTNEIQQQFYKQTFEETDFLKKNLSLGPFQYMRWETFEQSNSTDECTWYDRLAYVMLSEVASFADIFQIMATTGTKMSLSSPEIKNFYTCVLAVIRFLEGVSWGYSEMLLHESIEKDMLFCLKIVFESLQAIKQFYREDRQYSVMLNQRDDVVANYSPEPLFQTVTSLNALDRLIVEGTTAEKTSQNQQHFHYLTNQIFRKTYVSAKREIDDWLRAYNYTSSKPKDKKENTPQTSPKLYQSFSQLEEVKKNVLFQKSLSREFIRKLKNPELSFDGSPIRITKSISKKSPKPTAAEEKPTYEIDNAQNFFILSGAGTDTRIIVESFLQANLRIRSRYKCCAVHSCVRENKLTQDAYSIVKHIIYQIVRTVPAVQHLLLLQNHNYLSEILCSKTELNQQQRLQFETSDILVKFCKILSQIKLDFNIVVFITGLENCFEQQNLNNIVYVLRAASIYMPSYLKFILTLEKRDSKTQQFAKCIDILQTTKFFDVADQKFFKTEARSFLDFVFTYQIQEQLDSSDVAGAKQKFIEICGSKSDESYRDIVFMVHRLQDQLQKNQEVQLQNFDSIEKFVSGQQPSHIALMPKIKEAALQNPYFTSAFFAVLVNLRSPISPVLLRQLVHSLYFAASAQTRSDRSTEGLKPFQYEQGERVFSDQAICDGFKMSPENEFTELYNLFFEKFSDDLIIFNRMKNCIEDKFETDEPSHYMVLPRKRKMLKAVLHNLQITEPLKQMKLVDRAMVLAFVESLDSQPLASGYESVDPYLRLHIYGHLQKLGTEFCPFVLLFNLFTAKNIFKQLLFFGGYTRLRQQLSSVIRNPFCEKGERTGLMFLLNTLFMVEQTLKYEPFSFTDFLAQMRGRIIGDSAAKNLPEHSFSTQEDNPNQFFSPNQFTKRENLLTESDYFTSTYFENFHFALRENPRIDFISRSPGMSQVLALKFFSDKQRIILSFSCGLILLLSTVDGSVSKVLVNRFAVVDLLKLVDDKLLIAAGIDSKIRVWNIEQEAIVTKFEVHPFATSQLIVFQDKMFTYGYNRTISRTNVMTFQQEVEIEMNSHVTCLKVLKTADTDHPVKIAMAFTNGEVALYTTDLTPLISIQKPFHEEIIRLISLSPIECLCFYKEGQISILSSKTLEESKTGSIFSLKSDDYLDLVLIKSREYFLFTIEKQKIEFYSASSFKRSDSWDYFFERDIAGCDKNKEGSKICVWDKSGCITLFNFLKVLDTNSKETQIPCHRRYDSVVVLDVSDRLDPGQGDVIISCSLDRDLRVWERSTGMFVKKYDLSSFTAESVSALKLGKTDGMLFLGSKDMNVYLIDIARGKLCVVYEGHWSRVTSIYTIPQKDILVTLSESNIKVWDLEYDECIKNMNEHNSLIVYCGISKRNDANIVTISQSLEFKEWNYVTGKVEKSILLDLTTVRDRENPALNKPHTRKKTTTLKDSFWEQNKSAVFDESSNHSTDSDQEEVKTSKIKPKNIMSLALKQGQKSFNIVACHIRGDELLFLALDTNQIVIYSLLSKSVLFSFSSYRNEQVVFLEAVETPTADYLVVVTRTACLLYLLQEENVQRIAAYVINARKKPERKKHANKYSYALRFYFSTATLQKVENVLSTTKLQGPLGVRKSPRHRKVQATTQSQTRNERDTWMSQSVSNTQQNESDVTKLNRTRFLVCIGDSRGFVHLTHLHLN